MENPLLAVLLIWLIVFLVTKYENNRNEKP